MDLYVESGKIIPMRIGEKVITHLLFADDILMLSKGTTGSLKSIDAVLGLFAHNIGLV